ncbi:hypothetical protein ACQJBY_048554 [Aegilops geniculata]
MGWLRRLPSPTAPSWEEAHLRRVAAGAQHPKRCSREEVRISRSIDKSRAADWIEGACMSTPPPRVTLTAVSSHNRESTASLPPGIPSPARDGKAA